MPVFSGSSHEEGGLVDQQGLRNILALLQPRPCTIAPNKSLQTGSTFETTTLVLKSASVASRIAEYATSSIAWQPSDAAFSF